MSELDVGEIGRDDMEIENMKPNEESSKTVILAPIFQASKKRKVVDEPSNAETKDRINVIDLSTENEQESGLAHRAAEMKTKIRLKFEQLVLQNS